MTGAARLAALGLLLVLAACGRREAPSVLLVTIDTLRADHLSCYGYRRPTTPALDALAAGGLLFETARSQAPLTAPSHASILTGTLPAWHRVLTNGDVLPDGVETLAERLRAAGFHTAGFVSNATITHLVHFDQGFEHFDDALPDREASRPQTERVAAHTIDAALAWLADHHGERFFVWVHLEDPHGPYTPPAEHVEPFARAASAEAPEPLAVLRDDTGRGGIPHYQAVFGETDGRLYVARYDGEIHYADAEIGRLLAALGRWGVDPLVVVTADHGEALGDHGYFFAHGHGLTEDQIRVPLILRGPGVPAGVRSARPVEHIDIVPTLLARAGIPVPADLRGTDLLAAGAPSRPAIAQAFPDGWAVTMGGLKLVSGPAGAVLHDLAADAAETHDLPVAGEERAVALEHALAAEQQRPAPPWSRESAQSALLREQLRALGYVD